MASKNIISKTIALLAVLIALSTQQLMAQDPQFSQFYATLVYTNPAFAGTASCSSGPAGRATSLYRNHEDGYYFSGKIIAASFDQQLSGTRSGLGLNTMVFRRWGTMVTTVTFNGIYAYQFALNKDLMLKFGVQAGINTSRVDFSRFIIPTFYNSYELPSYVFDSHQKLEKTSITYPDLGAGMLLYSSKVCAGVAFHNILRPDISFTANSYRLPIRITSHFGIKFPLKLPKSKFESYATPNLLLVIQEGSSYAESGVKCGLRRVITGVWYRKSLDRIVRGNAVNLLLGYRSRKFQVSYSLGLKNAVWDTGIAVTHEVTAIFNWCLRPAKTNINDVRCPVF